ncbi:helix-turn-helix transcriptional regulator [Granulicella tundricola]|uniref:helix-turn-helix transcriptional regulator n=1 Tax=Granulicella tundricola TaxID=940615 RepID=UPI001E3A49EC|nr:helix-turn-helix transcriptional regulator [Granulicella tundricola]
MMLRMAIGDRIRTIRRSFNEKGVSQTGLAKHVGVACHTVSRWENGIYEPTLSQFKKIADFFDVPVAAFFPAPTHQTRSIDKLNQLTQLAKQLTIRDLDEVLLYAEYRLQRESEAASKAQSVLPV